LTEAFADSDAVEAVFFALLSGDLVPVQDGGPWDFVAFDPHAPY